MNRHHRAKLTKEEVELIRQLNEEHGIGYKRLAKKFDVGVSTIRDACTYRTW